MVKIHTHNGGRSWSSYGLSPQRAGVLGSTTHHRPTHTHTHSRAAPRSTLLWPATRALAPPSTSLACGAWGVGWGAGREGGTASICFIRGGAAPLRRVRARGRAVAHTHPFPAPLEGLATVLGAFRRV